MLKRGVGILALGLTLPGCLPDPTKQEAQEASNARLSSGSLFSTQPSFGVWDARTSFPGAGLYSGISNLPNATSICDTETVAGVTGTAICQSGTASSPANASMIRYGYEAWDASGNKMTGTMPERGAFDSLESFPGAGFYDGTVRAALSPVQIVTGNTILGIAGTSSGILTGNLASTASRNSGTSTTHPNLGPQNTSSQLTIQEERSLYGAADLPSTGGYVYRDIPDPTLDDDGNLGITCQYAPRPSVDCGKTQASISARIADCASLNPTASSWDGATQCNGAQVLWKLVTRNGANKEVWQDQSTGLLWSSYVATAINWCRASGATDLAPVTFLKSYKSVQGIARTSNGTIGAISGGSSSLSETITIVFSSATAFTVTGTGGASGCQGGAVTAGGLTTSAGSTVTWSRANVCSFTLTQGSTNFVSGDRIVLASTASTYSCFPGAASALQPASALSYCAEGAGLNAPAGENWGTGTYFAAKGLMGKNSTPSVRWRIPSIEDMELADLHGIRMVLPDSGIAGNKRPKIDASPGGNFEWTGTTSAEMRGNPVSFNNGDAYYSINGFRSLTYAVRCVGR